MENNSINFFYQVPLRSQLIYGILIVSLITGLAALPFIYTDVYFSVHGILESNLERAVLLAPAQGKVTAIFMAENKKVTKGTVLLTIDNTFLQGQLNSINKTMLANAAAIHDLCMMLKVPDTPGQPYLETLFYRAAWAQYKSDMENSLSLKDRAFLLYHKNLILHQEKVLSDADLEQSRFNYEQACTDWVFKDKQYSARWALERRENDKETATLKARQFELMEQLKLLVLKAPVSGSLQNLTGVHAGTVVSANQQLAEISPDTSMLITCYIKPAQIGYIKLNQPVKISTDGFNPHQWGFLKGNVAAVADDVNFIDGTPFFKVRCKLSYNYSCRKNNSKIRLKKGMTINVRFILCRKSFYQLLLNKASPLIDPSNS